MKKRNGDMAEMCQIAFKVTEVTGGSFHIEPFAMTASQHYYGRTVPWDFPPVQKWAYDTNRPVVWVASNTHATYFVGEKELPVYYKFPIVGHIRTGLYDYTIRPDWYNFLVATYSMEHLDPDDTWWQWRGQWGNKDEAAYPSKGCPGAPGALGRNRRTDGHKNGIHYSPGWFHNQWIKNPRTGQGDENLRVKRKE